MAEPFRWRSSRELDVDAYPLLSGGFLLFCILKQARLGQEPPAFWRRIAEDFGQPVQLLGRVLKTSRESHPLEPLAGDGSLAREPWPELWTAELEVQYSLEVAGVLNPGLFLDQQKNRARLATLVSGHAAEAGRTGSLLNLFSYTGSFSLVALRHGAGLATSIDLSGRYLRWEERNFAANFAEADPQPVSRRIVEDARVFLRRASGKDIRYDWIVIDPPTFARAEGKKSPIFKVQVELLPMVELASRCLAPKGTILVSCNDAGWADRDFHQEVQQLSRSLGLGYRRGETADGFAADHPLKSAWLSAG